MFPIFLVCCVVLCAGFCFVFAYFCLLPVSRVTNVASASGLSIHVCHFGFSQTFINPATIDGSACTKLGKWAVMYIWARGLDFTPFYDFVTCILGPLRRCGICCFSFYRIVLPLSLDFTYLIAPSVLSNVYLPYVASFSGFYIFDCSFGIL